MPDRKFESRDGVEGRRWRAVVRTWLWLPTAIGSLVLLWDYSSPSSDLYRWLAGVVVIALTVVAWLVQAGSWYAVSRDWLWIPPVAVVLVVGLIATDIPLRLRWWHSQRAFAEATQLDVSAWCGAADSGGSRVHRRVGSYDVSCHRVVGDAVLFSTGADGMLSIAGFAYLPDGELPGLGRCTAFEPLSGAWYTWTSPVSC